MTHHEKRNRLFCDCLRCENKNVPAHEYHSSFCEYCGDEVQIEHEEHLMSVALCITEEARKTAEIKKVVEERLGTSEIIISYEVLAALYALQEDEEVPF